MFKTIINKESASPIVQRPVDGSFKYWINGRGSLLSTTVAADLATGVNSTISGAITKLTPSNNQSLYFDGSNDSIVSDTSLAIDLTAEAFTLVAWINVTFNADHDDYLIVAKFPEIGITLANNGGTDFGVKAWVDGTADTNGTLNYGQWYHIAVAYQGANNATRNVYVDGVLLATDTSGTAADASGTVKTGYDSTWGAYSTALLGFIDDVRIYNKELGINEIEEIYHRTKHLYSF